MAGVAKSHCGKAGGMGDIPILENAICRRRGPGHYSPLPWRPSHNQNMTHEGGAFKGGVLHFPSPSLSLLDCPAPTSVNNKSTRNYPAHPGLTVSDFKAASFISTVAFSAIFSIASCLISIFQMLYQSWMTVGNLIIFF